MHRIVLAAATLVALTGIDSTGAPPVGWVREISSAGADGIRAATLEGAEALGREDEIGTVEVGKLADFVVVEENPLMNLKVLYGTGALKLDDDNRPSRVGGVKSTIKDGIVYDARALREDVKEIVAQKKAAGATQSP